MNEVAVGEQLDQFRVTRVIATTPTASILAAVDTRKSSPVTIKIPHPAFEGDPLFHANLLREARIGRRLDHPAVVKIFPEEPQSRLYIVSEFVEGCSLRALLRPHEPLETERALDYARQIAEALVYIHEQGVVHRDLKPENVVVTPAGRVVILDFGIALDRPKRRFTWLGAYPAGTPDYMAPEQARGLQPDTRADLCAVGVMLYEMLTGELPYPGEGPVEVMGSKIRSDPIPPTRFQPGLDPHLEEIVLHAIERRPERRYQTARELLADLQAPNGVPLEGRAAQLHPRTVREQTRRLAAKWASATVLVVAALVALVWLANRYPAGR